MTSDDLYKKENATHRRKNPSNRYYDSVIYFQKNMGIMKDPQTGREEPITAIGSIRYGGLPHERFGRELPMAIKGEIECGQEDVNGKPAFFVGAKDDPNSRIFYENERVEPFTQGNFHDNGRGMRIPNDSLIHGALRTKATRRCDQPLELKVRERVGRRDLSKAESGLKKKDPRKRAAYLFEMCTQGKLGANFIPAQSTTNEQGFASLVIPSAAVWTVPESSDYPFGPLGGPVNSQTAEGDVVATEVPETPVTDVNRTSGPLLIAEARVRDAAPEGARAAAPEAQAAAPEAQAASRRRIGGFFRR